MKAMILAAGLGTRLRPLTDHRPKALVEVAGRTLLEITLVRLQSVGVSEVIINVHHFADLILDYLKAHENFGMQIEISREDVLLDTGGGLKKAAGFFLESYKSSGPDEPFILHNVDVLSNIDLRRMTEFHHEHGALATLAVQQRKSSRYLLFDEEGLLCGRQSAARQGSDHEQSGRTELVRPSSNPRALAFGGIHIISPRMLARLTETGIFSIVDSYLRLAAEEERILAFRADDYYWRDLGRTEDLAQAAGDIARGVVQA